jgi:hypothetical protein
VSNTLRDQAHAASRDFLFINNEGFFKMVANCDRTCPLSRRLLVTLSAFAIGFSLTAAAQTSAASQISADAQSYSSSSAYLASLSTDDLLGGSSSTTPMASAAASASPSPQYGGRSNSRYPNYEGKWSHIAFVGGGGFTAPVGNATHGFETWGYNFDVGGGWNFTKKFGVLFEYQFNKNKIPGSTIALVGAQGGNINTHLFLFDPVYYFPVHKTTGGYVTGGVGFSRKVTNFTDIQTGEVCYYFCYYENVPVTVYNFTSTQLAADAGVGMYWKAFGPDSNVKLFAEARYIFVDSPSATKTSDGEGTEGIIPVTFGIRF